MKYRDSENYKKNKEQVKINKRLGFLGVLLGGFIAYRSMKAAAKAEVIDQLTDSFAEEDEQDGDVTVTL